MASYKFKATRSDIYNKYGKDHVIIIPYGFNVSNFIPTCYWSGIYGWNCDIFFGRDYAYTYGCRPFGSKSSIIDEKSMINTMKADGVQQYINPF